MPAVRLAGLTKEFPVGVWRSRPHRALDDVTLEVEPGEVLGYLGPNGAGKTTTFRLLLQLLFPTAGTAEILGRRAGDPETRRRIGVLPESPPLDDVFTAEELLVFHGGLCGWDRRESAARGASLLDRVGVEGERRRRLGTCSKGTRQRVGLALALLNDPEVLLLDEPMSGLDPLGRRDVRVLLRSLRDEGRTLFVSSHILSDAEALCTRVAILSRGRLVACGALADLGLGIRGWELVVAGLTDAAAAALERRGHVSRLADGRHVLQLAADAAPETLVPELVAEGARILSLTPQHETLEDYFLARVGADVSPPGLPSDR